MISDKSAERQGWDASNLPPEVLPAAASASQDPHQTPCNQSGLGAQTPLDAIPEAVKLPQRLWAPKPQCHCHCCEACPFPESGQTVLTYRLQAFKQAKSAADEELARSKAVRFASPEEVQRVLKAKDDYDCLQVCNKSTGVRLGIFGLPLFCMI